ncbi:Co2+/Mg2+ efflux protein ApaG [Thiothrix eikelboomii]|uniref:Protein ApaG n=1 Tax=Thiothrix eikelboomii TaxID=92487 RepID=A0A1T4VXS9_9GAMM|nr:Co2+/Mg2+ efflux protein ApaG [Thiothrix eikelboomii]SKA69794.1 ApaG protein [Thiothrix eikelboomii]
MSGQEAYDIQVSVEAKYLEAESDPEHDRYVFAYTITIVNQGTVAARLLTRHWIITDANAMTQEVKGDGVMGEQPYLSPGEGFRYTSGAVLDTPVGSMQGSYHLRADDGHEFDAPIKAFSLSNPRLLH